MINMICAHPRSIKDNTLPAIEPEIDQFEKRQAITQRDA